MVKIILSGILLKCEIFILESDLELIGKPHK